MELFKAEFLADRMNGRVCYNVSSVCLSSVIVVSL